MSFRDKLKKYFYSGLLAVLPISLTIYILIKLVVFFDNIVGRHIQKLGYHIPGIGIIFLVIVIFIVGKLANYYTARRFFGKLEGVFGKIPLINKIYITFKQLSHGVIRQNKESFKGVGLIEYPRKDLWAMVLLTGKTSIKLMGDEYKELITVFLPTTPMVTTGFLMLIEENEIVKLDLSVEEAIKIIVSGGFIQKESLN